MLYRYNPYLAQPILDHLLHPPRLQLPRDVAILRLLLLGFYLQSSSLRTIFFTPSATFSSSRFTQLTLQFTNLSPHWLALTNPYTRRYAPITTLTTVPTALKLQIPLSLSNSSILVWSLECLYPSFQLHFNIALFSLWKPIQISLQS